MEFAKNRVFDISYNAKLDRLEIEKENRIKKWCSKHKFMSAVIVTTVVAIGVNVVLIYQFFQVLATL